MIQPDERTRNNTKACAQIVGGGNATIDKCRERHLYCIIIKLKIRISDCISKIVRLVKGGKSLGD